MDLRQAASERGATEQQLNSKIFSIIEEVVESGEIDGMDVAKNAQRRMAVSETELKAVTTRATVATNSLLGATAAASETLAKLEEANMSLADKVATMTVTDPKVRDALSAYAEVLRVTKDIVGEYVSDAIWEKAIEEGGFLMWRVIMRPKYDEQDAHTARTKTKPVYL